MIMFWLLIILILYSYVGYPILLVSASSFMKKNGYQTGVSPEVTVLITAYNEEKDIADKLINVLSLDYPKENMEIIVASDGSTDRTDEIVKKFADKGVKLVRVEGRVGKTETQNQAVKTANGEIIVFSDATTKYRQDVLKKMVRNYADPMVGAVSGRYKYVDPKNSQVGRGSIAFWDYENMIKSAQSKIKTITGCCGCIYSVRRDLYEPLPADIISDLVEPLEIIKKGYRIVFEPEALAYETTLEQSDKEFSMRVRVITRGMRGLLHARDLFNFFKYPYISFQLMSHKVLRWFVPVFALGLYFSNLFILNVNNFYLLVFVCQNIFYLSAWLGWILEKNNAKNKVLSLPLYFCVVNLASLSAMIAILNGKKAVKWETVR